MRKRVLICLTEAQIRWLKEKNIKLSNYVQSKINEDIEKELLERPEVLDANEESTES